MNNKKIIFGFAIAFIISLNIYNIPFKEKEVSAAPSIDEIRDEKSISIHQLNEAINKGLDKKYNLMNYENIIVTFWATWCPSCRRENTVFNSFHKKNKEVLIIGVCVDKDPNALAEYKKESPLHFPTFNTTKDIAILFDDILAVPTHFIIDVKRQTVNKTMGLLDENQLKHLLGVKK